MLLEVFNNMDLEERLELIKRNTAEIVTLEELRELLETGEKIRGYLGYEPSGLFHIGWIIWANKVRDLVDAGIEFILLEATWHAWVNDKLGGDIENIRLASKYLKHCLMALEIPVQKILFRDAEELAGDKDYWALVIKTAKNTSLARAKRALTIMGRKADEAELDTSKLFYPFMQVSDIFYMNIDVALGGMDQRRAHMLARDIAPKLGKKKPVAIHTPLLTSLTGKGRAGGGGARSEEDYLDFKMSKSRPETTILIHDSPKEIREKLKKAYCPPKTIEYNPVIEINKYLLFAQPGFKLFIDRPAKYGGPITIESYQELEKMYKNGEIHPLDLKTATAEALIKMLEGVHSYFEENEEARKLALKIAMLQGVSIRL
jgi:tyrosyl-tRNA synthetase